ncbi:MAG TPA: PilZ domain-containing protein [Terriglobales bacterium]|nr:PilZ domain-containing protein [Terriglobales bacterium]
MALRSLLFSKDQEIVKLAGEVLKSLDIEVAHSAQAQDAVRMITKTAFDAIIVDNADAPGAVVVLSAAKSLPSCEKSVGVVLAISPNSLGLAEGARSHMVLYRPLSVDRLRNGVKAALGLRGENEDARASQRAPINIPATLRGAGLEDTLVFITNLSAGGAALHVGRALPSSSIHSIDFALPDTKDNLSTAVELVWRDVQGRMGIRFANASATFDETLGKWLAAHPVLQRAAAAGAGSQ